MSAPFVQPFAAVLETGVTELVGKDETVAQNTYSASVGVTLPGPRTSGEILQVTLFTRETGSKGQTNLFIPEISK